MFLRVSMVLQLDDAGIAVLEGRTEGWAAGPPGRPRPAARRLPRDGTPGRLLMEGPYIVSLPRAAAHHVYPDSAAALDLLNGERGT